MQQVVRNLAMIGLLTVALACGRFNFDPIGAGDAAGDAQIVTGAIAYWKLDEGSGLMTRDSISGIACNIFQGSSTGPVWVSGQVDGALQFVGDGDSVPCGNPTLFDNLPVFTVVAWIRPTDVTRTGPKCMFDNASPGFGWGFTIARFVAGDLAFFVHYSVSDLTRVSVPGVVVANSWARVAVSWDGSPLASGVHLYMNGSEVAYATSTDPSGTRTDDTAEQTFINCRAATTLPGAIDDVLVYDRVLTPTEVAAL